MKFVLNGKEIHVQNKRTILEVARENGAYIPSLCDHYRLSPFSGCRLCLVEIEGRKGYSPSCSTHVEEGMVIKTDSPQLKKLRQKILELILSEHPSSCLICSEKQDCDEYKATIRKVGETTGCVLCPNNGRCELQDVVEELEIDEVKFPALYRDFEVRRDDPFFDRNYNLCILCGRCVRMCHEVRGASALSFVFRGSDEVIGTVFDKPLTEAGCQFCGACVDVCPTGALTERAVRYETLPDGKSYTLCPLCGMGCTLRVELRNGRIISARPDEDSPVNRGQACVKGRFVIRDVVHSSRRITKPMIRKGRELEEVTWEDALDFVAKKLKAFKGKAAALIDSVQLTCEDIYTGRKFAQSVMKTKNVASSTDVTSSSFYQRIDGVSEGRIPLNFKLEDISKAKTVILMGSDLTVMHPIVWLEVLEAVKKGAHLIVVSPTEFALTRFASQWLRIKPGSELYLLGYLAKILAENNELLEMDEVEGYEEFVKSLGKLSLAQSGELTGIDEQDLRKTAQTLLENGTAAFLFGWEFTHSEQGEMGLVALNNLAVMTSGQLFPLGLESNQRGHYELNRVSSGPSKNLRDITQAVADGQVKALYLLGAFPWALKKKPEFLVYQGSFIHEITHEADAVLPATTFAETEGTFVNEEGRVQKFNPVIPPVGEAKPDWWVVSQLGQKLTADGFKYRNAAEITKEIQKNIPGFKKVSYADLEKGREIFIQEKDEGNAKFIPMKFAPADRASENKYPITLLNDYNLDVYRNFSLGLEIGSLRKIRNPEWIFIHPGDAAEIGVKEGDKVKIVSQLGKMTGQVKMTDSVSKGTARSRFIWSENLQFFAAVLQSLGETDIDSMRSLPVKIRRGN